MPVVIVYAGGIVLLIALAVVVYLFAVSSRKSYRCPQCGERITTEYLDAKRCGHCGAPLEEEKR